jgi:hypothetical protein
LETQVVDRIETTLAAQERDELHARGLSVEISREIQEVGLEESMVRVSIKRWPASQVDGTHVFVTIWSTIETGIHAVRRKTHLSRYLDIGGGKPNRATALVTIDDLPSNLVEASQHACSGVDFTTGKCTANCGGTDWLIDAICSWHKWKWFDREVVTLSHLSKQRDVSLAHVTEPEIFTDYDYFGSKRFDENSFDEMNRCLV